MFRIALAKAALFKVWALIHSGANFISDSMAKINIPFSQNIRHGITNFFWFPLYSITRFSFFLSESVLPESQAQDVEQPPRNIESPTFESSAAPMADASTPAPVAPGTVDIPATAPSIDSVVDASELPVAQGENGTKKVQQNKKEPKAKDAKEGASKPNQPQGGDTAKESGLSGKALKEAKKAGKQARRAQEKQISSAPPQQQAQSKKAEGAKGGNQKEQLAPKGGHKRAGSTAAEAQRTIPIRSSGQLAPTVVEPPQEHKHVSLFRHLDGNARRTSISGAASSVHPAVLTLGLQMSSYEICGSTARCVATLLAFKRVSACESLD
jgi:hypothetical protein